MKIRISILITLTCFLVHARSIRSVSWNLEWFPSGLVNRYDPANEPATISRVGRVLNRIKPDILFAQEIRDQETCEKLAAATGVKGLKVDICTGFLNYDDEPLFQQIAIFSIYPVVEAASERWTTFGLVDPPRGFAYALLDIDGDLVACYGVHLKSNYAKNDSTHQLNILKRELAASQLLRHINALRKRKDIDRFIIAGDFNTNLDEDRFANESTIRGLLENGFQNSFDGVEERRRVTLPSNGFYPDVTFDFILTRGMDFKRPARVFPHRGLSDHNIVSLDLTL